MRARVAVLDVLALVLMAALAAAFWPATLGGETTIVIVQGASMEPRLHGGDLVIVRRAIDYEVGDVVAYRIPAGDPDAGRLILHRIVDVTDRGFVMRGDNRASDDAWFPTRSDIAGRVVFTSPVSAGLILGLAPWICCAVIGVALVRLLRSPDRVEDDDRAPWPPPTTPPVDMAPPQPARSRVDALVGRG